MLKCGSISLIPSENRWTPADNTFSFLHVSHTFKDDTNWNFSEHGKLWNYNLQYFDFLHDQSISVEAKQTLIEDFSQQLLVFKIKPEPYPVSLRLTNWILFSSKTGYRSPIFEKALKYQADYLWCNLEYHILANHLLENLIALAVFSLVVEDERFSSEVYKKLSFQLTEQILPDGSHYECSPMYHCILLSRLILLTYLIKANKPILPILHQLETICGKMLGWLQAFSFEDGSYAQVNDSAHGIAVSVSTLQNAASDLKIIPLKMDLKESGFRKLKKVNYELLVDVGNITPVYQPGHAHSDALSFCLQHNGQPIVVDTGTSTYQNDSIRKAERATSAHNTVVYNNSNQSEVWSAFRVGRRAVVELEEDTCDSLCASHNGYKKFGVKHKRKIFLQENKIIIEDEMTGNSSGICKALFHLSNRMGKPVISKNRVFVADNIEFTFENYNNLGMCTYPEANGFNKTKMAYCLEITFLNHLNTKITFID